eukprot:1956107-Rhodomonas_salina.1
MASKCGRYVAGGESDGRRVRVESTRTFDCIVKHALNIVPSGGLQGPWYLRSWCSDLLSSSCGATKHT